LTSLGLVAAPVPAPTNAPTAIPRGPVSALTPAPVAAPNFQAVPRLPVRPGRSVNCALQPAELDWASQAAIVFVNSAAIRRVIPNSGLGSGIGWSALKLLLREVHDIAAQPCIVRKLFPGQRMIVRANAKKAAKRHYGIGDLPRALVDHEVVDRPEPLSTRIVNGGSFDLV
jgi:hypothetical protein